MYLMPVAVPALGGCVGIGPGPSRWELKIDDALGLPPPSCGDGEREGPALATAPGARWTTLGLDARGGAIVGIFRTQSTQSLGADAAAADTTVSCGDVECHVGSADADSKLERGGACLPPPPAAAPVLGFHRWLARTARGRGRADRRGGGDMDLDVLAIGRESSMLSLVWAREQKTQRLRKKERGAKHALS